MVILIKNNSFLGYVMAFLVVLVTSSFLVVYADNDIRFSFESDQKIKGSMFNDFSEKVSSVSDMNDISPLRKNVEYEKKPKNRKVRIFTPYSYELDVNASFYYWHDDWPEGSGTGITYRGNKCIPWYTVAVDPNVIPLGSKVYINGREYLADDIGGAIKGNKIDIAVNSREEAFAYGRRNLHITVVPPYGEGTYKVIDVPAEKVSDPVYLASLGDNVEVLPKEGGF